MKSMEKHMQIKQPDLEKAALNAAKVCLQTKEGDKAIIIGDKENSEIAESLGYVMRKLKAKVGITWLDNYGERPLSSLPRAVKELLKESDIGICCANIHEGEIKMRVELVRLIETLNIRYAHMVGISKEIMVKGLSVDYRKINYVGEKLINILKRTYKIKVISERGTNLDVVLDNNKYKWVKTCGIILPGVWQNLPAGEIFTTPSELNGTFVIDGNLGNHIGAQFYPFDDYPLILEIKKGYLKDAYCKNKELLDMFLSYCRGNKNSDRIGEFAIGTNIGLKEFTGNLLYDEKIPGVHIAFGDPGGKLTGAKWTAPTHIDAISKNCTIYADDKVIFDKGKFLI